MATKRNGRASFAVNAGVSGALLIVIATIALVVSPPAPPGVAAFAPQAAKPITKAPPGQTSSNGTGAGKCTAGLVCHVTKPPPHSATPTPTASATPTPTPTPSVTPTTGVPSDFQCQKWPDGKVTQTFDPQSPPCIADWPGEAKGNGGATAPGVTATTIKVALPLDSSTGEDTAADESLATFFNNSYEFYGRKIELVPYASKQLEQAVAPQGGPSDELADPTLQLADAETVDSQHDFAALDFLDDDPIVLTLPAYSDTLAEHHVISLVGGEGSTGLSTADVNGRAPYILSYYPELDTMLGDTAQFVCHQLVGGKAQYSGSYTGDKRTFALLLPDQADTGEAIGGVSTLESTLSGCGVKNLTVDYYDYNESLSAQTTTMDKLKSDGVTSVMYFPYEGDGSATKGPVHVAAAVGYDPEWIDIGWQDFFNASQNDEPGAQVEFDHTFGIGNWNKLLPVEQTPAFEALADVGVGGVGGAGDEDVVAVYHELEMLAAGIQMAGPHLTAQSLTAALRATTFPNPGAGEAPTYQATIDYGNGSIATDDINEWWLSGQGNEAVFEADTYSFDYYQFFCYSRLGERVTPPDGFPATNQFFESYCR